MNRRLQSIIEHWSLDEGALFKTVCTHRMESNPELSIPFRCGHGTIEYNEHLLDTMSDDEVELGLRAEVIRILLKHPYQRQPSMCSKAAVGMGSNLVLSDNYKGQEKSFDLPTPEDFELEKGRSFEWYSMRAESLLSMDDGQDGDWSGAAGNDIEDMAELSELWEEDCMKSAGIDSMISDIDACNAWGSLGGNWRELVKASVPSKMDYRKILMSLKPSCSSSRTLTRMKPNRRLGFDAMGYREERHFKILVGVDVSGSVSSESLTRFFGVIDKLFRYDVERMDVITFDTELAEPVPFRKAMKEIVITGRGGTKFQPIIDFADKHPEYDGLVVFTDGFAEPPTKSRAMKVVWVCDTAEDYKYSQPWMAKHGQCCYIPEG